MVRYQVWFDGERYATVSGENCDSPLLERAGGKLVHEYHSANKEDARTIRDRFVENHKRKLDNRRKVA